MASKRIQIVLSFEEMTENIKNFGLCSLPPANSERKVWEKWKD